MGRPDPGHDGLRTRVSLVNAVWPHPPQAGCSAGGSLESPIAHARICGGGLAGRAKSRPADPPLSRQLTAKLIDTCMLKDYPHSREPNTRTIL